MWKKKVFQLNFNGSFAAAQQKMKLNQTVQSENEIRKEKERVNFADLRKEYVCFN